MDGRVYVLNHRIDRSSDLVDIRLALFYTPLYCVLITRVEDFDLAHEFAEPADILKVDTASSFDPEVMDLAWHYADESEMAVLVIGEAQRLEEVKRDGTKEAVCL